MNSGYEIEKSEHNSNIEEQERQNDLEDYFNGEKDAEENVIYLEDVDDSEADSKDKDEKEDEN